MAGHDVCAVLVELVQGEGGVLPLDWDFVRELAQLCEKRDWLLLVDEVQTCIGLMPAPLRKVWPAACLWGASW